MSTRRPAGLEGFKFDSYPDEDLPPARDPSPPPEDVDLPPDSGTPPLPDDSEDGNRRSRRRDPFYDVPLVAPGPIQETSFIEESEVPPPTSSEATGGYSPVSQDVPLVAPGPIQETSFIEESEAPPPTYSEATGGYSPVSQDDGGAGPDGEPEGLSPEEIAVVLKMQDDRNSYIPKTGEGWRGEAEMEMEKTENGPSLNAEHADTDEDDKGVYRGAMAVPPARRRVTGFEETDSVHTMEAGDRHSQRSEPECTDFGPLNEPLTRVSRYVRAMSPTRLAIAIVILVGLIGLVVFLGVFPASFVYVEYHEIALPRSKMTGAIDRENVYESGCYILGPDTELVRFPATAQQIDTTMGVFTKDTISISISFSVQYFLRPQEVGQLHKMFGMDYQDVFYRMITSSMRNLAGSSLTVDNFRFNRTYVERMMHNMLRERLGGDCCPLCCPRNCQSNTYCSQCKLQGNCNKGYYIDVRFFNLKTVTIPQEVFERYLHQTVLKIQREREFFYRNSTLLKKETEKMTKRIKNEGKEIEEQGHADGEKIKTIAAADFEKVVQNSYARALKGLYSNLSVVYEDHKLSLMMIRALEDVKDNLYYGYGFESNTLLGN